MRHAMRNPRSQTMHERSLHSTLVGIAALAGVAIVADVATTAQTSAPAEMDRATVTVEAAWWGERAAALEASEAGRSDATGRDAIPPAPGPITVEAPELHAMSGQGPVFLVPPTLVLPTVGGEEAARSGTIPPAPGAIAVEAPHLRAATGEGSALIGTVTLRRPSAPVLPAVRP